MRLPRNLHMEVDKVLCLPRPLHMEATQSAVPATKSALQETSENSNHNGGTIRT